MILTKYLASGVIVVSFNTSVGSSLKTKNSFFLSLACIEEALSIPKITTFLPHLSFDNNNCGRASNPIP